MGWLNFFASPVSQLDWPKLNFIHVVIGHAGMMNGLTVGRFRQAYLTSPGLSSLQKFTIVVFTVKLLYKVKLLSS